MSRFSLGNELQLMNTSPRSSPSALRPEGPVSIIPSRVKAGTYCLLSCRSSAGFVIERSRVQFLAGAGIFIFSQCCYSLFFVGHAHVQTPTFQPEKLWLSHSLTLRLPTSGTVFPAQDIGYSAILSCFVKGELKTFLFSEYFS